MLHIDGERNLALVAPPTLYAQCTESNTRKHMQHTMHARNPTRTQQQRNCTDAHTIHAGHRFHVAPLDWHASPPWGEGRQ